MATTVFVPGTVIVPDWLNDVNDYVYNGGGPAASYQRGQVVATAGQTVFTVPFTYNPAVTKLDVYINGIHQRYPDSYAQTDSTTVTFTEAVPVTAVVEFVG